LIIESHCDLLLHSYFCLELLRLLLLGDHSLHYLKLQELCLGGVNGVHHAIHAVVAIDCGNASLVLQELELLLLLETRSPTIERRSHGHSVGQVCIRVHVIHIFFKKSLLLVVR
jgi:hypothetical protein